MTTTDKLALLASDNQGQGTLVSLVLRKKGTIRGTGDAKKTYGDDLVHVLLWAGFSYKALVLRSFNKLEEIRSNGTITKDLLKAAIDAGVMDLMVQDACEAVQEIDESFQKFIRGTEPAYEDGTPKEGIWEPLKVEGQIIHGAKVYMAESDTIEKGTVYLDGVKLGERILIPAENGHWHAKQKAKTVAKELLRKQLPVGLYVRYTLAPEYLVSMKIGQEAGEEAKRAGIPVDPESIRSLFKIAA